MATSGSIKFTDFSSEISFVNPNLPSSNTPAQNTTALQAIAASAFNEGLALGLPTDVSFAYKGQSGVVGAIASTAQRELKFVIVSRDTTEWLDAPTNTIPNPNFGKLYSNELPTANAALLASGTDTLDLADVNVAAFVTVWEANAVSPSDGVFEVQRIYLAGRNL